MWRSWNWRDEKGLQELLLVTAGKRMDVYSKVCCCLDFFLVAVFFFFLVCAVSMDSSKVGKCRIACRSCLSRGRETKNKTHTHKLQFPLFEKALSTHIRQECCCFSFPPFSFFGCFPPCLVGNNRCRHTLFCFKSLVVVDLICFPRWFVSQ